MKKNKNFKVRQVQEMKKKSLILFQKMDDLKEIYKKLSAEEIEEELEEIKQLENEILLLHDEILKK